ncbi:hypothetical protein Rhopal_000928-T1 [Rhodotorula paludigena]|uniref:F-box domain-containing protein n=1 Tax=Rhodotorula paludigena TaxID=86838 RepID=A0AAV5GCZ8_9BASI|nr:hypothetical protein Rhopal_000928-T1 [Rhodotorula paludigena]
MADAVRPRFRRRFSRSLTSLGVSLSPNRVHRDEAAGKSSPGSNKKLAKWRAKGKAKLLQAFTTPESPPASPTSAVGTPLQPFASMSARLRSQSAPILTNIGTRRQHSSTVPCGDTPRPQIEVLADTASSSQGGTALCRSPTTTSSVFETCPSSPIDSAGAFAFPSAAFALQSPPNSFAASIAAVVPSPPRPPDYFKVLPLELQLLVFRAVVETSEHAWAKMIEEGTWVGEKARARWGDGRAKGRRELTKLGRVCKLWRSLSLDGQLWSTAAATSLLGNGDAISAQGLLVLLRHAGPFVRTLDLRGLGVTVNGRLLESAAPLLRGPGHITQLTKIDLTGCTAVTTSSLSTLIALSPGLRNINVRGLPAVHAYHLASLGTFCSRLTQIEVSRCPNLSAHGLLHLPYPPPKSRLSQSDEAIERGGLRSIKAAGLVAMDADVFARILHRHPGLEMLDVSYSADIADYALKKAVTPPDSPSPSSRPLSSAHNEAGSPAAGSRRIFPALRHLNLSSCRLLSSSGLAHLAGALPNLEILELSCVGWHFGTDGLARLLLSVPKLRKLDLEDAAQTTDDALFALVPSASTGAPNLEHLVISSCKTFTDAAIAAVVHGCTKLRVLEADGTAISDATAKAFVSLARQRRTTALSAAEREHAPDPLFPARVPAVLSILDNRTTSRRISRDLGWKDLRPRTGQRGYWTRAVDFYHDDEPPGDAVGSPERAKVHGVLDECDSSLVVVRSFYSHLAVDAAYVARAAKEEREEKERERGAGGGARARELLRSRAMSDSEILRLARGGMDDEGTRGCLLM